MRLLLPCSLAAVRDSPALASSNQYYVKVYQKASHDRMLLACRLYKRSFHCLLKGKGYARNFMYRKKPSVTRPLYVFASCTLYFLLGTNKPSLLSHDLYQYTCL